MSSSKGCTLSGAGPQYLLGDSLNYWRRERSADVTPKYVALGGDYSVLYDHLDYVAGLEVVRVDEPTGRERPRGWSSRGRNRPSTDHSRSAATCSTRAWAHRMAKPR